MTPSRPASMALRVKAMVSRVLAWLRLWGCHSTGAIMSANCGRMRMMSELA